MTSPQKICFIIMGFGLKTDPETGRSLDLDKSYRSIIKPAVEAAGFRCIRADEVSHSGVIDVEMYNLLLQADMAICDISTANPNALYELGVRHALRPFSTIIMSEDGGKFHFDLNHLVHFRYTHLGTDIGYTEAIEKQNALRALIAEVADRQTTDSPVYVFLPSLQRPTLSAEQLSRVVEKVERAEEVLSSLLAKAQDANSRSMHALAEKYWMQARTHSADEPYVVQQHALSAYKSKIPDTTTALERGWEIISTLDPENSTDPETLGIAGAIRKRQWLTLQQSSQLDQAIELYRRGYEIRRDYYTGENYAMCLDMRAHRQEDRIESVVDSRLARRVRENLLLSLKEIFTSPDFSERSDARWILATLANLYLGLGRLEEHEEFDARFKEAATAHWEIETYEANKAETAKLARPTAGE